MAKKASTIVLSNEDILRIARMTATEPAGGTFVQQTIATNLSVERGFIWLINFIEFRMNLEVLHEVSATNTEFLHAQITRESKAAILGGDDPDVVQQMDIACSRSSNIGTDAGPLYFLHNNILRYEYRIPMLYAAQDIFLGVQSSASTPPHTVTARIGYTIKEVSDQVFFRIAQSLSS
jgi:hypothetical protein